MEMSDGAYGKELEVAARAVGRAARLCRAVRLELKPEALSKEDSSPVTIADFGAQALIGEALLGAFPSDPVISEEDSAELAKPENTGLLTQTTRYFNRVAGSNEREPASPDAVRRLIDHGATAHASVRFWTVDPIDGTKGFLRGGQYAIALALVVNGRVVVAALACPELEAGGTQDAPGAIFFAVRGQGAHVIHESRVERIAANARRIGVGTSADPAAVGYCESVESSHSAQGESALVASRLGIRTQPRRIDSQAKYALVARGDADLYLRLPTRKDYREKIWDHAAGALLVEEAGGTVTDITGRPLEFHHGRELVANQGVVVSNGRIHQAVIAAINAQR